MLDTEKEGSQTAKFPTRSTTQSGDTTRSTTWVGDTTRLMTQIERAGAWKLEMEDILGDIEKKCEANDCRSRMGGQRRRRLMVNFPRALRVEQSVAMDLKTRQGVVVKNKELAIISHSQLDRCKASQDREHPHRQWWRTLWGCIR